MGFISVVEPRMGEINTQYRESPKLLHVIRTALTALQEAAETIAAIPSFFDIDTAVGDQLTIIGKALGWPRRHCICDVQPVLGFECEGYISPYPLAGGCDANATWLACDARGFSDVELLDDELYRKFLKVRRYQFLSLFDRASLTDAIRIMWGDQALILDDRNRQIVIAPGRALTSGETAVVQLFPRVLPVALGMRIRFHFGTRFPVTGFGDGWGGPCDPAPGSSALGTGAGELIITSDGFAIATEAGTDWMCPVDVHPYDCV